MNDRGKNSSYTFQSYGPVEYAGQKSSKNQSIRPELYRILVPDFLAGTGKYK